MDLAPLPPPGIAGAAQIVLEAKVGERQQRPPEARPRRDPLRQLLQEVEVATGVLGRILEVLPELIHHHQHWRGLDQLLEDREDEVLGMLFGFDRLAQPPDQRRLPPLGPEGFGAVAQRPHQRRRHRLLMGRHHRRNRAAIGDPEAAALAHEGVGQLRVGPPKELDRGAMGRLSLRTQQRAQQQREG